MKLTIDGNNETKEIEMHDWQSIDKHISTLNGDSISFCILESPNGDYIQCAGSVDKMTIELRIYNNSSFKHYRLGYITKKKLFKNVWSTIDCKVGPIRVHDNEVLELSDALSIFKGFFIGNNLTKEYNRRNITKDF